MGHALADNPLPGIDEARMQRLESAGVTSLEDVVEAGPKELARITGFGLETSRALVRVAAGALAASDSTLLEFVPPHAEAASKRLARGLRGARDIEGVRSAARNIRDQLGKRPPRVGWRKSHRRARKQLARLMLALEDLQRDVLTDGLSRTALNHLRTQLGPLQAELERAEGARQRKRLFKRIGGCAKQARRTISA